MRDKTRPSIAAAPSAKRPLGEDAANLRPTRFDRNREAMRWTECPSTIFMVVVVSADAGWRRTDTINAIDARAAVANERMIVMNGKGE
mmetsp:Transcript_26588/g.48174  ORF Transcript_26588/g.48174 Transcript_26588/m.48174 type:complete len:88 (-) Transcript_26588:197-460(-)